MKLPHSLFILVAISLHFSAYSYTGTATLTRFVEEGSFSVAIAPEVVLTPATKGLGANISYTHGFSDLVNASLLFGVHQGQKQFRVGAILGIDFFPDTEGQPGIGVGIEPIYYRRVDGYQFELVALPYLHKSFSIDEMLIDPYISFPFGMAFTHLGSHMMYGMAMGSHFQTWEHVSMPLELGLSLHRGEIYVSTGIHYYY
jgi:hypothetical protein